MPIDLPPVIQPPAIYREARPFRAVSETVMPADYVAQECYERAIKYKFALPAAGHQFVGCSLMWPDRCVVLRIDREDVRQHELAHCKGWPADHPGGR